MMPIFIISLKYAQNNNHFTANNEIKSEVIMFINSKYKYNHLKNNKLLK